MTPNSWPLLVVLLAGLLIGGVAGGLHDTIKLTDGPATLAITNRLTGEVRLCMVTGEPPRYRFSCR